MTTAVNETDRTAANVRNPLPVTAPKRRLRRRAAVLKTVRRIHLYSGLFLLPWVLLYGVTAFLFNHPSALSKREVHDLGPEHFSESVFEKAVDPDALAGRVVAALREHWNAEERERMPAIGDPLAASLSGSLYYSLQEENGERGPRRHTVRMDWDACAAKAFSSPAEERAESAHFAVERGLRIEEDPFEQGKQDVRKALSTIGIETTDPSYRAAPSLGFDILVDEKPWKAVYRFRDGSLSATPDDGTAESLTARSFLTRLHVAHGYSPSQGFEWVWALIVDLMALAMCLWGLSGIVMWWNMKKVRSVGAIVIGTSVVVAASLAIGMLSAIQ
ncbi:MAG: hypothetical protein ACI8X5_000832 [Planctomycetota bacterium]|jgi:hypothetical protein